MTIYDVTGIGNAIVDVLAPCTDQFLRDFNIQKGAMTLIDEQRAKTLYNAMNQAQEISGGSCANTMAGIASFGGKGAYIGLVANDSLGDVFTRDLESLDVTFNTPPLITGLETARSFIFITPDGERSMNTFLGACTELSVEHIDHVLISNSKVTYMEGYLFDKDPAKEAFTMAADIALQSGKEVSLSLSDSFCVKRHRLDFLHLIQEKIDILFANEAELMALFETDNFDNAFYQASKICKTVVATRSEKGALISHQNVNITIPATKVVSVVDLTGAGDQFAAGFLYGYTHSLGIEKSGKLGAMAAAEVLSHVGPRPLISYSDFIKNV